nr:hypothetical protein Itr_chr06CG16020 [Ipomoea trifida]
MGEMRKKLFEVAGTLHWLRKQFEAVGCHPGRSGQFDLAQWIDRIDFRACDCGRVSGLRDSAGYRNMVGWEEVRIAMKRWVKNG